MLRFRTSIVRQGCYTGLEVLLLLPTVLLAGCFTFRTPEHVLRQRDAIQGELQVNVDISHASSFTGDVGGALDTVREQVACLPARYRAKIGTIIVRDGFFTDYFLMSPFVAAFTTTDGTIYVRNANPTRLLQSLLLFHGNDALVHEIVHSVQFNEMHRWQQTGRPSREFAQLIRDWELQYFGDVDGNGRIDDADAACIAADTARFDPNRDGQVNHADVEAIHGQPYVQGRWASLRGMQVLLWMSFEWFTPRPKGFACPYAKTCVWEDAAETVRYAWRAGFIPALYAGEGRAAERAWAGFARIERSDPLLARKVLLMVRYIAAHEEPGRLGAAWLERGAGALTVAAGRQ